MVVKNVLKPLTLASVNSNTFDGSYKVLSSGIAQALVIFRIVNDSDKDITISYDGGVTDHEFLQAGDALLVNTQTNALPPAYVAQISKGTKISVKGLAGAGLIYLSGWYAPKGGE